MATDAKYLRRELRRLGLSEPAITAAWPGWWSDDAENSASARAELRFSLARKLGLDPRSLLEDEAPRFVWHDEAKFKRLSTETDQERAAITSFGASIGRALIAGTSEGPSIEGISAEQLRSNIVPRQPFIRLVDLLALGWAIGVPIAYLKVFPLSAKRMCAMAVRVGNRYAVLLGKDAKYPAPIAYYLAHEIGHAALGHLKNETAVVDLRDPLEQGALADDEELAADRFALELLTGNPEFAVSTETRNYTASQLAASVMQTARPLRVEPGTLALCFGHTTGQWRKANAAMRIIYSRGAPVWRAVNAIASQQLDWTAVAGDTAAFLRAVMGGISTNVGRD